MSSATDRFERLGVAIVSRLLLELDWYPREPARPDHGIDLYAEASDGQRLTGRMLAMQIKSGPSYLRSQVSEGFVYRGTHEHLRYWLRHSLPVLLVLVDVESETAYWVAVSEEAVELTERRWKTVVPRSQKISQAANGELRRLAERDPYELGLSRLRSERTWMQHLAEGGRLMLEAEEWINKTSGRGTVRLIAEDANGHPEKTADWTILAPGRDYTDVLPSIFPWAEMQHDEWTYEDAERDQWANECGIWDSEDQGYAGYTFDFEEWRRMRLGLDRRLRPYEDNGEVAFWRLELSLGDLGRSFLELDRFLAAEAEVLDDL